MPHGRIGLRWGNMKLITTVSKKKNFLVTKKKLITTIYLKIILSKFKSIYIRTKSPRYVGMHLFSPLSLK